VKVRSKESMQYKLKAIQNSREDNPGGRDRKGYDVGILSELTRAIRW